MLYVLRRFGRAGRLSARRIERDPVGLNVFTGPLGTFNEYISGGNLRGWCVLGPDSPPLHGWDEVMAEDGSRLLLR